MKIHFKAGLLTLTVLGFSFSCLAQSGRVRETAAAALTGEANKTADEKTADTNDSRTAAQLFEEADKYTQKKFEAFQKLKMPYDAELEGKIRREQRDLAARYATVLAARKLKAEDVYYLGLLYILARNFDAALDVMRRFLTENPGATGEPAQNARAVIVIQAAKKGLLPEAESRLKQYLSSQPQIPEDRY